MVKKVRLLKQCLIHHRLDKLQKVVFIFEYFIAIIFISRMNDFLSSKITAPLWVSKILKTHGQHKQTLAEYLNRTLIHNNGG